MTENPVNPDQPDSLGTAPGVTGPDVDAASEPVRARDLALRPPQPYEEGNKAAVTHGAYSRDLVNKTADEIWDPIFAQIQTLQGYHDVDQLLVAEFRQTTAQLHQLRKRTTELGGLLDREDKPRPYWVLEDKLARRWLDQAKALGIGAAERAKVFGAMVPALRAHAEALRAQERLRAKAKKPRKVGK